MTGTQDHPPNSTFSGLLSGLQLADSLDASSPIVMHDTQKIFLVGQMNKKLLHVRRKLAQR
jgi:hypothetical protein